MDSSPTNCLTYPPVTHWVSAGNPSACYRILKHTEHNETIVRTIIDNRTSHKLLSAWSLESYCVLQCCLSFSSLKSGESTRNFPLLICKINIQLLSLLQHVLTIQNRAYKVQQTFCFGVLLPQHTQAMICRL